ncbi:hypothetical protein C8A01DRAFT_38474 [Parachaetomium inaequale]|uniref:Response regulatory domain-containing protein n=1 Tax=Parachaetomium inaequale TaxID=2588326 RepID=A0AAN6SPM0_9PEZI|nr:hypothetical protein C8A01DRAFT_38474 [Parachaetomium inaequale]
MPPSDVSLEDDHGSAADEDLRNRCMSLLLSAKNKQPAAVENAPGTSTGDTHEPLEAELNEAKRTRDQLLTALTLARMTVFTVGLDRNITMLEGALARCPQPPYLSDSNDPEWYIGYNVYHLLDRLYADLRQTLRLFDSLESVLNGKSVESFHECEIDGHAKEAGIEGAIGCIMGHAAFESQAKDPEIELLETHLDDDTLDFHRTGSATLDIDNVRFSVPEMMREVADVLRPAAESKGLVMQQIAPDVLGGHEVIGDSVRLRQVLTNLLANSIESTSRGHVEFWVERKQETSDTTTLSFLFKDTGRVTEVDSGHSRAPSSRRTEHGLGISKAMVESLKGRMTFDSVPGKGTTVALDITFQKPPCSKPPCLQTTESGQTSPSPNTPPSQSGSSCNGSEKATLDLGNELPFSQRGNITVLVVENDPHTQRLTLTSIQKLGFQTATASNGEEALEYITAAAKGKRPKPGVILMDVQMPILDGSKCTHTLRHHIPYRDYVRDVAIVGLTTEKAVQGGEVKGMPAGMVDLLPKPVAVDVLERVLVWWAARGRRLSEDVANEKKKNVVKTVDGKPVFCDALELDCGAFERMMELAWPEIESADHSDWLTGKEV